MNSYSFFITSLIIILLPGTGVIYTISLGMMEGRLKSIYAAIGCTIGIVPHLCISIALSSFLMQINERVLTVVKYAGVLYLFYLGVGMLLSKENIRFSEKTTENKVLDIIRRGILINLLNPKLTLFFFSFLPQYIHYGRTNYILESAFLGLMFMLLTFIVFVVYGCLAGTVKIWMCKSEKRMSYLRKCFGISFIGFAVRLAMD